MAGRASAWSDPRVLELARQFVPAADEVWRLQRGADPECLFFQRAVNGGKPITDDGTRQGIWVIAPGGKLLAHVNSANPEHVAGMLEKGLAAWHELPAAERRLSAEATIEPTHRWDSFAPQDGLILERIVRDLPASLDPAEAPRRPWNRDFAWFTKDEARAWLPADPQPGAVQAVPAASVERLARFHLVDNVRGQTIPYAAEDLELAALTAKVLVRNGSLVELALAGEVRAVTDGTWKLGDNLWKPGRFDPHGIEIRLIGRAVYDLDREAFIEFELLSLGNRFGKTVMNGRHRDPDPAPIGFHFQLAAAGRSIAPTFVAIYEVPWIPLPQQGRELRLR